MACLSNAMRSAANIVQGQNGANKLSTSGSPRVDAFTLMLQATTKAEVTSHVNNIISEYRHTSTAQRNIILHDLFVLAFHKRATSKNDSDNILISDGEGFRDVFYHYILELYNHFPNTVIALTRSGIFSLYGYWKDYINLWKMINEIPMSDAIRFEKYNPMIEAIREAFLNQRTQDIKNLQRFGSEYGYNFDTGNSESFMRFMSTNREKFNSDYALSWVGKYCVRESSTINKTCYWFVQRGTNLVREDHISYMVRHILVKNTSHGAVSFPSSKTVPFGAKKLWRKQNSYLNVALDVPEVKFCCGQWSNLNISRIPSVCLHRNKKGLLNEKSKLVPSTNEHATGNRFPDNEDRVDCRQNIMEHILSGKKVNASQLLPNQIVGDPSKPGSVMEQKINEATWSELLRLTREKMDTMMETILAEALEKGVDKTVELALSSGNILCCCDTSASMTWVDTVPNRPYDIGVALTAFCSSLASEHYKDLIMTFSTTPSIVSLRNSGGDSLPLYERIARINASGNHGSTNYIGMHEVLIDLCVKNNIPAEERPVTVVFTDGEFNNMMGIRYNDRDFTTLHDRVVKMWVDAGYPGPPVICYWNVAPNRNGVQTEADKSGVIFLQGPSPSNIKYLIYGETADEVTKEVMIDGKKVTVTTKDIDPMQVFRKAMDQSYFGPVREILEDSEEGAFALYSLSN